MAVTSNAIYNAATAPYVSSSVYYGYVPLCRRESASGVVQGDERAGPGESLGRERCVFDSPMETDDDGRACPVATRGLSNHCLIPEASTRHRLFLTEAQLHRQLAYHQPPHPVSHDADALLRRRNRKRCNAELESATQLKRLREEAVVTAAFTMVQEVQKTVDWPRCVMNHYA